MDHPVFHIVLPICQGLKADIFLDILKCAVGRVKLDECNVIGAFKSAMCGESFMLETDDITSEWNDQQSEHQQARRSSILGFWAIENFASLGKQLHGKTYQAPTRHDLQVSGSTSIEAKNVDDIVIARMKLRVIELSVNESTFIKLKNFVKVPGCVVKRSSGAFISRKMDSFDVVDDYVVRCWKALKCGEFITNSEESQFNTVMYTCIATALGDVQDHQVDTIENIRAEPPSKRLCRRHVNGNVRQMNPAHPEAEHNGVLTHNNNGVLTEETAQSDSHHASRMASPAERANKTDGELRTGSLRAIILKIQDDIGLLSDSVQQNGFGHFQNMERIINDQIAKQVALRLELETNIKLCEKLRIDLAASHESNANIKSEAECLREKMNVAEITIREQENVNNALRIELETNTKLCEKLQVDLAASHELNTNIKSEAEWLGEKLNDAEKTIREQKNVNTALRSELETNTKFCEKLQVDLAAINEANTNIESELKCLSEKLCAAEDVKEELTPLKTKSDIVVAELYSDIESLMQSNSERSKSGSSTQTDDNENSGGLNVKLLAENELMDKDKDAESEFETVDPIVKACRSILLGLEFGWMKFGTKKNAKFCPGFVYPPDGDGISRAQKVELNGYPSTTKYKYFEFNRNISEDSKKQPEKSALNKLNMKFKFDLK